MFDVTVVVAGEAGQGVRSAGDMLCRLLVRSGYHVFAYPDVESRIRGGHNFTRIRVSDEPVESVANHINVLLSFDDQVEMHRAEMVRDGVMLYDAPADLTATADTQMVRLEMAKVAKELGASPAMAATVGLGAVTALVGIPRAGLEAAIREQFAAKGRDTVEKNLACCRHGFEAAATLLAKECPCRIPPVKSERRLLMTGNEAMACGALAAGARFYAGYPMSPSTGVMEFLAGKQAEFGLVVEPAEDEIAAINMVLGASYAGARALTATSGGGFALMVEALGYAGMAELPLVVVLAQRPGPATGFPTRTEQAELLYALDCSQDEFPRFVFAPGNAGQAHAAMVRAFELAERYQVPAIVLSDQQLSDSYWTVDQLEQAQAQAQAQAKIGKSYGYRRYEITESGVSPRLAPGTRDQLVCTMGSEHDEAGLSTEDAGNRTRMHDKRMRKLAGMAEEFGRFEVYPEEGAENIVACFGSARGAVREAVELLQAERRSVAMLHLAEVYPLQRDRLVARLARCRRVITVENNATGQLARLLRRETRIRAERTVLKYDGRPFAGAALADELRGACE